MVPVTKESSPTPGATPASPTNSSGSKNSNHRILKVLRAVAVDLPLIFIFATLLLGYFIQHLYTEYYPRLLDQYERKDEDHLAQYTYYHRYCTTADVTTADATDLLVDTNGPVDTAVDQLMTHGGVVIPQLLQSETALKLREYVDARNRAINDKDQFPMYPPQNRLSYGFDATESPVVVKALQEIGQHAFFNDLIKTVLGDEDPAACELTTIASFYGADDQGWHSDTKEFGNALKFSRSYTHTYSLFLALQNTTMTMGATEICPGTHMCANPLEEVCEDNRMSVADAAGGQIGAGDGALLSQMVWHRGAAHQDPNAPERIMFIITFLARPRHEKDPRQFAKGTYFHLKWGMWGNTLKDLKNPMEYMKKPYSILRALGLWKPSSRNWGYDMVTSLMMQLSNEMLHGDDLEKRLQPRMDAIGFPRWLRGPLLEDQLDMREAWKAFWDPTISKTLSFLELVNFTAHLVYGLNIIAFTVAAHRREGRGVSFFGSTVLRTVVTHGFLYLLYWSGTHMLANTKWGKRVWAGQEMIFPFPDVRILTDEELAFVPKGPTTIPAAQDVLFGSRFDSKWMGTYERYLDWHKGNRLYRREIATRAPFYQAFRGLPDIFQEELVKETIRTVTDTQGRFLDQDFRVGTWHILTEEEQMEKVERDLTLQSSPLQSAMVTIVNRLIAEYRFGVHRDTRMASKSWVNMMIMKNTLFGNPTVDPKVSDAPSKSMLGLFFSKKSLSMEKKEAKEERLPAHRRFILPPPEIDPFQLDTKVYVRGQSGEYFRGDIVEISESEPPLYTVAMETSEEFENLTAAHLSLYKPVTEGDRVQGCFQENFRECFPGTVKRVLPDASIAIEYDDGDFDDRRPRNEYFLERPVGAGFIEQLMYYAPENFR